MRWEPPEASGLGPKELALGPFLNARSCLNLVGLRGREGGRTALRNARPPGPTLVPQGLQTAVPKCRHQLEGSCGLAKPSLGGPGSWGPTQPCRVGVQGAEDPRALWARTAHVCRVGGLQGGRPHSSTTRSR